MLSLSDVCRAEGVCRGKVEFGGKKLAFGVIKGLTGRGERRKKRPLTGCNWQSRQRVSLEKMFGACGAEGDVNDGGVPYGTGSQASCGETWERG